MNANAEQQAAITSISNTVVRASAGSGKTFVIAQRYIHLVRNKHIPITDILCLTFTRKAAHEMHERIYTLLQDDPDPNVRKQVLSFHQSCISTIDSFCADIVRSNASAFGLPELQITEPQEYNQFLYHSALEVLLYNRSNSWLSRIIAHRGLHTCARNLLAAIIARHSSLAYPLPFPEMQKRIYTMLLQEKARLESAVHKEIQYLLALPEQEAKIIMRAHATFKDYQKHEIEFLCEHALTFDLRSGVKRNNDYSDQCKEHIKTLREYATLLPCLGIIDEPEHMQNLYTFLQNYQDMITHKKIAQKIYSYHDISELAIRMLRENVGVRRHYKKQFRYIMIDEFQDNNERQRDLLYLLAERYEHHKDPQPGINDIEQDKLFFVGDEKQSIFSFRGADVRVFSALATDMKAYGSTIELTTNYRSSHELVQFFNTIFPQVFTGNNTYDTSYKPVVAYKHTAETTAPSLSKPAVTIAVHENTENAETQDQDMSLPVEAEAAWVAKHIASMINHASKPLSPSDIAILLRSNTAVRYFERALRHNHIPYIAQASQSVFTEAPLNDLYVLLTIYLQPENVQNYATCLRSPLVRISDYALVKILLEKAPIDSNTLFATAVPIGKRDTAALNSARRIYDDTRKKLATMTPIQFVHMFWYEWGYQYYLLKNPSLHPYLQHLDALMYLAQKEPTSLSTFAEILEEHITNEKRLEKKNFDTKTEAVQIMTIHAAKGLEFPVVFVCDMDAKEQNRVDDLFDTLSREEFCILPDYYIPQFFAEQKRNYFSQTQKEERKVQNDAEAKRLLYVALTRAEQQLFLTAHKKSRSSEESISLFKLLGDALAHTDNYPVVTIPSIRRVIPKEHSRNTVQTIEERLALPCQKKRTLKQHQYAVTACARMYNHLQTITPQTPHSKETTAPHDHHNARTLGSITHDILHKRITQQTYTYQHALQEAEEAAYVQEDNKNISTQQIWEMVETAWELSDVFLCSSFWVDHEHHVVSELPFSYRHTYKRDREDRHVYIRGSIDLIMESADTVKIVDFKTDKTMHPALHTFQLALYDQACKYLYPQKRRELYLFYVRADNNGEQVHHVSANALPTLDNITEVIDQLMQREDEELHDAPINIIMDNTTK